MRSCSPRPRSGGCCNVGRGCNYLTLACGCHLEVIAVARTSRSAPVCRTRACARSLRRKKSSCVSVTQAKIHVNTRGVPVSEENVDDILCRVRVMRRGTDHYRSRRVLPLEPAATLPSASAPTSLALRGLHRDAVEFRTRRRGRA